MKAVQNGVGGNTRFDLLSCLMVEYWFATADLRAVGRGGRCCVKCCAAPTGWQGVLFNKNILE